MGVTRPSRTIPEVLSNKARKDELSSRIREAHSASSLHTGGVACQRFCVIHSDSSDGVWKILISNSDLDDLLPGILITSSSDGSDGLSFGQ
jgi:hypothetical protein